MICRFQRAPDALNLSFTGKVFDPSWETLSLKFTAFEFRFRRVFITKDMFDYCFNFRRKMAEIFVISLFESKNVISVFL